MSDLVKFQKDWKKLLDHTFDSQKSSFEVFYAGVVKNAIGHDRELVRKKYANVTHMSVGQARKSQKVAPNITTPSQSLQNYFQVPEKQFIAQNQNSQENNFAGSFQATSDYAYQNMQNLSRTDLQSRSSRVKGSQASLGASRQFYQRYRDPFLQQSQISQKNGGKKMRAINSASGMRAQMSKSFEKYSRTRAPLMIHQTNQCETNFNQAFQSADTHIQLNQNQPATNDMIRTQQFTSPKFNNPDQIQQNPLLVDQKETNIALYQHLLQQSGSDLGSDPTTAPAADVFVQNQSNLNNSVSNNTAEAVLQVQPQTWRNSKNVSQQRTDTPHANGSQRRIRTAVNPKVARQTQIAFAMSLKEMQKRQKETVKSSRGIAGQRGFEGIQMEGRRTKTGLEARQEGLIDQFVTDEEKFREKVLHNHLKGLVNESREKVAKKLAGQAAMSSQKINWKPRTRPSTHNNAKRDLGREIHQQRNNLNQVTYQFDSRFATNSEAFQESGGSVQNLNSIPFSQKNSEVEKTYGDAVARNSFTGKFSQATGITGAQQSLTKVNNDEKNCASRVVFDQKSNQSKERLLVDNQPHNENFNAIYHSLQENDLNGSKRLFGTAVKQSKMLEQKGIKRGFSCQRTLRNSKDSKTKVDEIQVYSSSKVKKSLMAKSVNFKRIAQESQENFIQLAWNDSLRHQQNWDTKPKFISSDSQNQLKSTQINLNLWPNSGSQNQYANSRKNLELQPDYNSEMQGEQILEFDYDSLQKEEDIDLNSMTQYIPKPSKTDINVVDAYYTNFSNEQHLIQIKFAADYGRLQSMIKKFWHLKNTPKSEVQRVTKIFDFLQFMNKDLAPQEHFQILQTLQNYHIFIKKFYHVEEQVAFLYQERQQAIRDFQYMSHKLSNDFDQFCSQAFTHIKKIRNLSLGVIQNVKKWKIMLGKATATMDLSRAFKDMDVGKVLQKDNKQLQKTKMSGLRSSTRISGKADLENVRRPRSSIGRPIKRQPISKHLESFLLEQPDCNILNSRCILCAMYQEETGESILAKNGSVLVKRLALFLKQSDSFFIPCSLEKTTKTLNELKDAYPSEPVFKLTSSEEQKFAQLQKKLQIRSQSQLLQAKIYLKDHLCEVKANLNTGPNPFKFKFPWQRSLAQVSNVNLDFLQNSTEQKQKDSQINLRIDDQDLLRKEKFKKLLRFLSKDNDREDFTDSSITGLQQDVGIIIQNSSKMISNSSNQDLQIELSIAESQIQKNEDLNQFLQPTIQPEKSSNPEKQKGVAVLSSNKKQSEFEGTSSFSKEREAKVPILKLASTTYQATTENYEETKKRNKENSPERIQVAEIQQSIELFNSTSNRYKTSANQIVDDRSQDDSRPVNQKSLLHEAQQPPIKVIKSQFEIADNHKETIRSKMETLGSQDLASRAVLKEEIGVDLEVHAVTPDRLNFLPHNKLSGQELNVEMIKNINDQNQHSLPVQSKQQQAHLNSKIRQTPEQQQDKKRKMSELQEKNGKFVQDLIEDQDCKNQISRPRDLSDQSPADYINYASIGVTKQQQNTAKTVQEMLWKSSEVVKESPTIQTSEIIAHDTFSAENDVYVVQEIDVSEQNLNHLYSKSKQNEEFPAFSNLNLKYELVRRKTQLNEKIIGSSMQQQSAKDDSEHRTQVNQNTYFSAANKIQYENVSGLDSRLSGTEELNNASQNPSQNKILTKNEQTNVDLSLSAQQEIIGRDENTIQVTNFQQTDRIEQQNKSLRQNQPEDFEPQNNKESVSYQEGQQIARMPYGLSFQSRKNE